jgi:phosphatidylglycerophosphatase A
MGKLELELEIEIEIEMTEGNSKMTYLQHCKGSDHVACLEDELLGQFHLVVWIVERVSIIIYIMMGDVQFECDEGMYGLAC